MHHRPELFWRKPKKKQAAHAACKCPQTVAVAGRWYRRRRVVCCQSMPSSNIISSAARSVTRA
jgi:hypothetical protein